MDAEALMARAIRLAEESLRTGGGPFGAVVARAGTILGEGANRVVPSCDPTAHAEVIALREASRNAGTHDLSGCELYTSCEPCPMCLGAAYWAHVDRIHYAATRDDAAAIGFDDAFLYEELSRPLEARRLPIVPLLRDRALEAFRAWSDLPDKQPY